jgi:hypothetical protein
VVDLDGLGDLTALVKLAADHVRGNTDGMGRTESSPPPWTGGETPKLALWVLLNLASNEELSPRISAFPGCIEDIVVLMVRKRLSTNYHSAFGVEV